MKQLQLDYLVINLQLFAEDGEPEVDNGPEDVVDDPADEPNNEPAAEPDDVVDDEPAPPPVKKDEVPLSKYIAEKKKRQELERILNQQQAEQERLRIAQEYIDQGYPEQTALYHADRQVKQSMETEQVKSKLVDLDIRELGKDSFYSDADAYADEIKEEMRSNPRLSAKQAYMLIRGEARTREYLLEQEQLKAAKRRGVEAKKVTNSTSSAPQSPFKLSDTDKKALAGLQKMDPDAGWTVEKFYKLMKS